MKQLYDITVDETVELLSALKGIHCSGNCNSCILNTVEGYCLCIWADHILQKIQKEVN